MCTWFTWSMRKKHSFVSTSLRLKHRINKNNSFLCQLCLLILYLFKLTPLCIFDIFQGEQTNRWWTGEKWNISEVKQAANSTSGTLHKWLQIPKWFVKTLRLRISEINTVISTELYYYWPPRFSLSPVQRSRCRFDLLNLSIANCGKDCFRRSWKRIIISKRCLLITCANWRSRWPFEETFWWPQTLLRRSMRFTGRYFKRYEGRA